MDKREKSPNPLDANIEELISAAGIRENRQIFKEMIAIALGLGSDGTDLGDLKQFKRVMREIRDANRLFAPYKGVKKISVFGSARTSPNASAWKAANQFGKLMQEAIVTAG